MKWFNNLKMIQKLLSSFIIVAIFIGIVGYVGVADMRKIKSNLSNIYLKDLESVQDLNGIKINL